jgi:hypothetical protein
VISADESPICDSGPRPLSDVEIKSGSRRELCWNLLTRLRATSDYPIMRRGQ